MTDTETIYIKTRHGPVTAKVLRWVRLRGQNWALHYIYTQDGFEDYAVVATHGLTGRRVTWGETVDDAEENLKLKLDTISDDDLLRVIRRAQREPTTKTPSLIDITCRLFDAMEDCRDRLRDNGEITPEYVTLRKQARQVISDHGGEVRR